jgi:hypothetical protein
MYKILPITKSNLSEFALAKMVLTLPVNVFTVDQHIAVLGQIILTLQSAKKNFYGVEITQLPSPPTPIPYIIHSNHLHYITSYPPMSYLCDFEWK